MPLVASVRIPRRLKPPARARRSQTKAAIWRRGMSVALVWATIGGTAGMAGSGCKVRVPDPPPPAGDLVGRSGGAITVSPMGSAVYSIPIAVPPGTGGAVPSLALVYDSGRANGPFGVGWSLSGLSSIGACSATIAQDGYLGWGLEIAQTPTTEPAFCLNGQRLVPMNGGYPGANGTEHRLRTDPTTRAFSHGGGGGRWWTVEYADGSQATFGTSPSSRVASLEALVDRFEDVNGNYLTVTYDEIGGGAIDKLPLRIDYSGNAAMGVTPYNAVEFEYGTRPDRNFSFYAGQVTLNAARVSAIATYADGAPAMRYELSYATSAATGRSLLQSASICAGGQCLPPTTFAYDDPSDPPGPAGWGTLSQYSNTPGVATAVGPSKTRSITVDAIALGRSVLAAATGNVLGGMAASYRVIKDVTRSIDRGGRATADWNGDGCGDLIFQFRGKIGGVVPINNSSDEEDADYLYTRIALSAHCLAGGQGHDIHGSVSTDYDIQDVPGWFYAPDWEWVIWQLQKEHYRYVTQYGDVDGDGRSDVITLRRSVEHPENGWRYVVQYAAGGTSGVVDPSQPSHWDSQPFLEGNGYADPNEHSQILSGDFNGDGRIDLMVYTKLPNGLSEQARIFESAGPRDAPFFLTSESTLSTSYSAVWEDPPSFECNHILANCDPVPIPRVAMVGDVNGDGRSDLIVRRHVAATAGNDHLDVHLAEPDPSVPEHSRLRGFAASTGMQSREDGRNQRVMLMDFDSNGLVDVVELVGSGGIESAHIYKSRGESLVWTGASQVGGWGWQSVDEGAYRYIVGNFGLARAGFTKLWRDANLDWRAELWVADPLQNVFYRESNDVVIPATVQQHEVDMFVPTDWEGDGIDDIAYVSGVAASYDAPSFFQIHGTHDLVVRPIFSSRRQSDLLTEVRDGLGFGQRVAYLDHKDDRVSIDYPRTVTPALAHPSVPFRGPLSVVHTITDDDYRHRFYRYAGAVSNRASGELSFREIWVVDGQQGLVTSTEYEQSFPLSGRVASVRMRPIAIPVQDLWWQPDLGIQQWAWSITGITHDYVWQIVANQSQPDRAVYRVVEAVTTAVEQDPDKVLQSDPLSEIGRVHTVRTHDAFGYPLTTTTQVTDAGGLQWTRSTTTSYQHNLTDWVLGASDHETTSVSEAGDVITRAVSFALDSATGRILSATNDPGTAEETTTSFAYDGFGNAVSGSLTAPGMQPVSVTTAYDPSGRMKVGVDRGNGHEFHLDTFDARFGAPGRLRSANGVTASRTYDAFGMLDATTLPTGRKRWLRQRWVNDPSVPEAVYRDEIIQNGTPTRMTYRDRRGRVVRTAVQGYDGRWSVSDVEYLPWVDRVAAVSKPRFENDPNVHLTTYDYDSFWRLSQVTAPGHGAPRITTIKRDGLETTIVGPNGSQSIVRKDGLARIRETENHLGQVTRTEYTPAGQVRQVVDPLGNVTSVAYDLRQQPVAYSAPDSGVTEMTYDRLGRISSVVNAKGERESYTRDWLGRVVAAEGREGLRTWTYDQQGPGLLDEECGPVPPVLVLGEPTYAPCGSESSHYRKTYAYDSLTRVRQVTERIQGTDYVTDTGYDAYGRQGTIVYPETMGGLRLDLRFRYTATGYLEDAHPVLPMPTLPGGIFYRIDQRDASGRPTRASFPGATNATWNFDPATGEISQLMVGSGGNPGAIRRSDYTYDSVGNVVSEIDFASSTVIQRDYVYDALSRLVGATTSRWPGGPLGTTFEALQYDVLSNITRKGDLFYTYAGTGPHQVTRTVRTTPVHGVVGDRLEYDAAGNVAARIEQIDTGNAIVDGVRTDLDWAPFGKIDAATRGAESIAIEFGAGREQVVREETGPLGSSTSFRKVVSVAGIFRSTDGINEFGTPEQSDVHYIAGAPLPVVYTNGSSGVDVKVLGVDRRGSVKAVVDGAGAVVNEMDYEPWGTPDTASGGVLGWTNPLEHHTEAGFGGHDLWDTMRLVDMGGRVYDPGLGRFLSADPFYADGLDRYGYVRNNPATRTDPSGYASASGPGGELEIIKHADTRTGVGVYAWHEGASVAQVAGAAGTVGSVASLAIEIVGEFADTRLQDANVQGGGGPQFSPQEIDTFEAFSADVRWYMSHPQQLYTEPDGEAEAVRKLLDADDYFRISGRSLWEEFYNDLYGEYPPNRHGLDLLGVVRGNAHVPSDLSKQKGGGALAAIEPLVKLGEQLLDYSAEQGAIHQKGMDLDRARGAPRPLAASPALMAASVPSPRRPWLRWTTDPLGSEFSVRSEVPSNHGQDEVFVDPFFDWDAFLDRYGDWLESQGAPRTWPDDVPVPRSAEQWRFHDGYFWDEYDNPVRPDSFDPTRPGPH